MADHASPFTRGERVLVRGASGREGILRIWEIRSRGLLLCSDVGYQRLQMGLEAPLIGFPWSNIVGKVTTPRTQEEGQAE